MPSESLKQTGTRPVRRREFSGREPRLRGLVPRSINTVAFGHRCIPPGCVSFLEQLTNGPEEVRAL